MSRTLADMTPDERQECVGRWAEVRRHLVIIAEIYERDGDAAIFRPETQNNEWYLLQDLTPRLDLPRAWTPSGEPVPGEWEERTNQDGIGDYIRFTRQRRYITDWEPVTEDTPEPNQPRPEDVKPDPQPGEAWLIEYEGKRYEAVYWYSPIYAHWAFVENREGLKTVESNEAKALRRLFPERGDVS